MIIDCTKESVVTREQYERIMARYPIQHKPGAVFHMTVHRTMPEGIRDGETVDGVLHVKAKDGKLLVDMLREMSNNNKAVNR